MQSIRFTCRVCMGTKLVHSRVYEVLKSAAFPKMSLILANYLLLHLYNLGAIIMVEKKAIFCAISKWCKKYDFLAIITLICSQFLHVYCNLFSVFWPKLVKKGVFWSISDKKRHTHVVRSMVCRHNIFCTIFVQNTACVIQ